MPSQKPIFKKEYESIDNYEESTWMGNDTPFMETEYTGVFRDRYPCVPGHTLFIPKKNTPEYIGKSYGLAYQYGNDKVKSGEMAGFNVGESDLAANMMQGMSLMVLAIAYISWQMPNWAGDNLKSVGMFFALWHVIYLILSGYQMMTGMFPSDGANLIGNLGPDVIFAILFFWKSR